MITPEMNEAVQRAILKAQQETPFASDWAEAALSAVYSAIIAQARTEMITEVEQAIDEYAGRVIEAAEKPINPVVSGVAAGANHAIAIVRSLAGKVTP